MSAGSISAGDADGERGNGGHVIGQSGDVLGNLSDVREELTNQNPRLNRGTSG